MTEKDYNPKMKERKAMEKQTVAETKVTDNKIVNNKSANKVEQSDSSKKELTTKKDSEPTGEAKKEDKKPEEKKKPIQKKPAQKKTEAVVNVKNLPISSKVSFDICRFIKEKKIDDAVAYLEQVVLKKKAIPMRGEIPHRKGKIMSGRFPKKASEHFIKILKSLKANAIANNLEEPVITEAVSNFASRPRGKFGRVQKKRTHVTIKCKEKKESKKSNKKEKKK